MTDIILFGIACCLSLLFLGLALIDGGFDTSKDEESKENKG